MPTSVPNTAVSFQPHSIPIPLYGAHSLPIMIQPIPMNPVPIKRLIRPIIISPPSSEEKDAAQEKRQPQMVPKEAVKVEMPVKIEDSVLESMDNTRTAVNPIGKNFMKFTLGKYRSFPISAPGLIFGK